MSKYIKNKNFIPVEFIEKVNNKSNDKNNKLIIFLLIINIFIIPNSISNIKNTLDNRKVVPVVKMNTENENINKEKIKKIINIINNNINSIKIKNNIGIIDFNLIEEIYKMEEENIIKINTLNFNNENKISVEVEL